MKNTARHTVRVSAVVLALTIFGAVSASAQLREFTGKVDRVTGEKLIVDNRMGDRVTFDRAEGSKVEGEKTSWDAVAKGDWVTVSWKMMDQPRKAYILNVLPPQDEPDEGR